MVLLEKIYYFLRDLTSKPDERGERSAGYLQDKIRQAVLSLAACYKGRLLEVGCGEGLFLSQLIRVNSSIEAFGVDNWPEILSRAKELFQKQSIAGIKLIEADAKKLPFEDSFFDAVIFVNVLVCVKSQEDAKAVLRQIRRVSKPGAKLIVEFRNKANLLLRLKYKFAKYYDATLEGHPLSTYYKQDVAELLKEFGYKIIAEQYIGFPIKAFAPVIIMEAQKQ